MTRPSLKTPIIPLRPFLPLLIALLLLTAGIAEERHALVIGNSNYSSTTRLKNPANDALDISEALKRQNFEVTVLLDADLISMEQAVVDFGEALKDLDSTGLFFYAGHGVQSGGENYLIPVDARIPSESYLKSRSIAMEAVLSTLQSAHNKLNIIILDACRDNPFAWSRSASRGLSMVQAQPTGSIIAYSTSAGSVAQDGEGRNGVFTSELLKNISTPGLEINEVFRRTGAAVTASTGGRQVPAIYSQFFDTAYLAGAPPPVSALASLKAPGAIRLTDLPVNALYVDVNGQKNWLNRSGEQVINDVPADVPVTISFTAVNSNMQSASVKVAPKSGTTVSVKVPTGTCSVPWLSENAIVSVDDFDIDFHDVKSGHFESSPLLPGEYTFSISCPSIEKDAPKKVFSTKIAIREGEVAKVSGVRQYFERHFAEEKAWLKSEYQRRAKMDTGAWASLTGGVVGAAVAGTAYFLGAQAYSLYSSLTDVAAVDDTRSEVEKFAMIFAAGAGVGGLGSALSAILFTSGPKKSDLAESDALLDLQISALRKAGE